MPFWPMFPSYNPWKHKKNIGFLVFSEGIKWTKLARNELIGSCTLIREWARFDKVHWPKMAGKSSCRLLICFFLFVMQWGLGDRRSQQGGSGKNPRSSLHYFKVSLQKQRDQKVLIGLLNSAIWLLNIPFSTYIGYKTKTLNKYLAKIFHIRNNASPI